MLKSYLFLPIYLFLKALAWVTLRVFYRKITIYNKDNLSLKGPLIIVSNHPNTLIDPVMIACHTPRILNFLANAGLYKNLIVGTILKVLYTIPVERPQDTGGKPIDNKRAFQHCDELLERGGCLYIAAEGTSYLEKRIRPLKTGTFRIAFEAEAGNNYQLGVKILPVGIHYSGANKSCTDIIMTVGEPILAADYREEIERDYFGTVRKATADLEEQLKNKIVNVDNVELEQHYDALYALTQHEENGLNPKEILTFRQEFAKRFSPNNPSNLPILEEANTLQEEAHSSGFSLQSIALQPYSLLLLILLAPFIVPALTLNWFVFLFPVLVIKWVKPVIEYHSTFKYLGGVIAFLFSFPIHYHFIYQHFCFKGWHPIVCKSCWVFLHIIGIKLVLFWKNAFLNWIEKRKFKAFKKSENGKLFMQKVEIVKKGIA